MKKIITKKRYKVKSNTLFLQNLTLSYEIEIFETNFSPLFIQQCAKLPNHY